MKHLIVTTGWANTLYRNISKSLKATDTTCWDIMLMFNSIRTSASDSTAANLNAGPSKNLFQLFPRQDLPNIFQI